MPLLLLGFAAVHAALLCWGIAAGFEWMRYEQDSVPGLIATLLLTPTLVAWVGAEFVNLITPRRVFDRRRRTQVVRLTLGLFAGVCSAAAAAALLPAVDRYVPDAVVFGSTGFVVMALCVAFCSRMRAGHCIHCGYDLRQSPAPGQAGAGRCPECGAATAPGAEAIGPGDTVSVP